MTTATLFNCSYQAQSGRNLPPAPPNMRRIVIVGGGSAGWMTALTFARSLLERGVQITVLESPTVGTIGVGEGSTPWLRGFFDSLGIEEAECSIRPGWRGGASFPGCVSK
jgi:glycine/D-amino acid oxidase-like deaminating enzyme